MMRIQCKHCLLFTEFSGFFHRWIVEVVLEENPREKFNISSNSYNTEDACDTDLLWLVLLYNINIDGTCN